MSNYQVENSELSGFGMSAWRHKDGKLHILGGREDNDFETVVDEWPQLVDYAGSTWALESIVPGRTHRDNGATWESAIYA